jgi:AcrR family transcriptional regulator
VAGLRERKKEQTRQRIAETARGLFAEHGFDEVTVAQVAREAEVAEATVFNYFSTKEALYYSGLEAFGEQLVDAVRGRPAGTPALAAFRARVLGAGGQLDRIAAGDGAALEQMRTTARVISSSAALRVREKIVLAEIAESLAGALMAGRTGDGAEATPDPVARSVANALMGVHSALLSHSRDRLLADDRPTEIAADVRAYGERAFALLEHGLGMTYPGLG